MPAKLDRAEQVMVEIGSGIMSIMMEAHFLGGFVNDARMGE